MKKSLIALAVMAAAGQVGTVGAASAGKNTTQNGNVDPPDMSTSTTATGGRGSNEAPRNN